MVGSNEVSVFKDVEWRTHMMEQKRDWVKVEHRIKLLR